jgi:hypothetical protein
MILILYLSILPICSLIDASDSNADYVASNDRMIVNNELETIWKEAVIA